jgi:hypothetical protein
MAKGQLLKPLTRNGLLMARQAVQQSPEEPFGRKVAELVQAKKG